MSETMKQVEKILPNGTWDGGEVDRVVLDYEDRFRRRMVLTGENGTRVLLELAKPQLLEDGDGLFLHEGEVIRVCAAKEKLAEIRCNDPHHMMRVAWHLGNRHLPTQILEDRLVIRDDHVIVDMVKGLGGEVTHILAPFTPEGGAYGHGTVQGHDHGHSHSHGHSHD